MALLNTKKFIVTFFGAVLGVLLGLTVFYMFQKTPEEVEVARSQKIENLRSQVQEQFHEDFQRNSFPSSKEIVWNDDPVKVQVNYTIDSTLQSAAEKLLRAYKPDYGVIVAIEPSTGKIRAMASYTKGVIASENLALRNTYPAASIFKIVTATAALQNADLHPNSLIPFNGSNHTLYKSNVLGNKKNRWTRNMSFKEAFAKSVNVVFGRIGLFHIEPQQLLSTAEDFGFNQRFSTDLPFDVSLAEIPDAKDFHLAELASGFNKVTTLSPIHGAMIAASITQKGTMKAPFIVESLVSEKGESIYQAEKSEASRTMSPEVALELKQMMEATIFDGTSRRAFRPLVKNRALKELKLGGKTGSLTGNNPRGKTDWFVGYAMNDEEDALAIAALTVNVKYWTVKSAHLAQTLFATKFKELNMARNEREPAQQKKSTSEVFE